MHLALARRLYVTIWKYPVDIFAKAWFIWSDQYGQENGQETRNTKAIYFLCHPNTLACSYFAKKILKLDEQLNVSLRIYRTSAVDWDSFKATMDSIAQWMSRRRSCRRRRFLAVLKTLSILNPPYDPVAWIQDTATDSVSPTV